MCLITIAANRYKTARRKHQHLQPAGKYRFYGMAYHKEREIEREREREREREGGGEREREIEREGGGREII